MSTKKPTTAEDLEHKMRAQLVGLYESACEIPFPKGSDAAFRDALQARLQLGCGTLAKECALDEGALISTAQDVRLYRANAGVRNPDASTLSYRIQIQKNLGKFFKLAEAVAAGASVPAGKEAAK
jgi:hypothetical protein